MRGSWVPSRAPSGIQQSGVRPAEQAAEEAHDPRRDMPRGILLGLLTLVVCAFLTLVLSSGISPGAEALSRSDEPLFEGFRTIFGAGLGTRLLALVAVAGLAVVLRSVVLLRPTAPLGRMYKLRFMEINTFVLVVCGALVGDRLR